jgi:hypothetical protein
MHEPEILQPIEERYGENMHDTTMIENYQQARYPARIDSLPSQGKCWVGRTTYRRRTEEARVRGWASYEIPDGNKWYWFDQNPGTETFYVVASYTPENKEMDNVVTGCATVVKKLRVQHR